VYEVFSKIMAGLLPYFRHTCDSFSARFIVQFLHAF
jgi:hypothetical protein